MAYCAELYKKYFDRFSNEDNFAPSGRHNDFVNVFEALELRAHCRPHKSRTGQTLDYGRGMDFIMAPTAAPNEIKPIVELPKIMLTAEQNQLVTMPMYIKVEVNGEEFALKIMKF